MELIEQIRPESSAVLIARYFEGKTYPLITFCSHLSLFLLGGS